MAEKTISLGNLRDVIVYDDDDFPDGVVAPNVLLTQAPTSQQHAVRVSDMNSGSLDPHFNSVTTHDLAVLDKVGFGGAVPVAPSSGWSTSNVTERKTVDADTVTLPELADAFCTLVNYLLARGDLRP